MITKTVIFLIKFYQKFLSFDRGVLAILAPGGACRYEERCSQYTIRKISEEGLFKGLMLGARRIISCR